MSDTQDNTEMTIEELEQQKINFLNMLLEQTENDENEIFKIATTQISEESIGKPGIRYSFHKTLPITIKNIDYRTTLPNEIIFELDHKVWKTVKETANKIIETLVFHNIPYYACSSGGKGVHIHVFFKINFNEKIKLLLNKACDLGYVQKNFRVDLLTRIILLAGFKKNTISPGGFFDTSAILFDELEDKGKLIRVIGGRKLNKKVDGLEWNYKKVVIGDFPERKNLSNKRVDFNFPEIINLWDIPEEITIEILEKYIEKQKNKQKEYTYTINNVEGGFLNLCCVLKGLDNIKDGKRHIMAYILTMACKCDGLDKIQCGQTLERLYEKFPNKHTYTKTELKSWIPSVYGVWKTNFIPAHRILEREHICDGNCFFNENKYLELINFLKDENLLLNIIKIIQQKVDGREYQKLIGEEQNILHLFLTYLSAYTDDPQNRHTEASTSAGKSYTATSVLEYFPEDDKITVAGMSKKAIYYSAKYNEYNDRLEYNLNNKMITFLEESESMDFLKEIKPILSHDLPEIQYKVTVEKNKEKVTESIFICGHPAYVGLSVLNNDRAKEQESREWTISIKEEKEKFDNTTLNLAKKNIFNCDILNSKTIILKEAIKFLKPILNEYKVYNPFKEQIYPLFSSGDARVQRDIKRFESMINLVTKLHIYQRNILLNDKIKAVVTQPIDIYYALGICQESIKPLFSGLLTKYYNIFKDLFDENDEKYGTKDDKGIYYTIEEISEKYNNIYNKTMDKYNLKKLVISKFISNNLVKTETHPDDGRKGIYRITNTFTNKSAGYDYIRTAVTELLRTEFENYQEKLCISNVVWGMLKNKRIRVVQNPYITIFSSPPPLLTNILFPQEKHKKTQKKQNNTINENIVGNKFRLQPGEFGIKNIEEEEE